MGEHFNVGTLDSARERFSRTAELCAKIFNVQNLNAQAFQLATFLDHQTGSYAFADCISDELDIERKIRDRRRGMALVRTRPSGRRRRGNLTSAASPLKLALDGRTSKSSA
jgi:hypothetical protein